MIDIRPSRDSNFLKRQEEITLILTPKLIVFDHSIENDEKFSHMQPVKSTSFLHGVFVVCRNKSQG